MFTILQNIQTFTGFGGNANDWLPLRCSYPDIWTDALRFFEGKSTFYTFYHNLWWSFEVYVSVCVLYFKLEFNNNICIYNISTLKSEKIKPDEV